MREASGFGRPGQSEKSGEASIYHLVGNGPFRLKSWRANLGVVLERNPNYCDVAHVRLREAYFSPIENLGVEENAFRNGLLHMTSFVPLNKIDVYAREQPGVLR
ncbi:MAG: hypothetical protein EXS37_09180 [Opitutus sp.]|nr:hypothetical protein [Opitutus sp.]